MEMNMTNLLWFFAFIFLAGGNGFGGLFGGNRPMGPAPATQSDVNDAINNQTILTQLGQQNDLMLQTNNTNQINMIQGFNALQQQINQLSYHMDNCCCEIKTQMLQDRLTDKTAEVVALQNKIDNRDQTAQILNNLGRFVTWAGSGTPAVGAVTG